MSAFILDNGSIVPIPLCLLFSLKDHEDNSVLFNSTLVLLSSWNKRRVSCLCC
jgi:hypothetical protein